MKLHGVHGCFLELIHLGEAVVRLRVRGSGSSTPYSRRRRGGDDDDWRGCPIGERKEGKRGKRSWAGQSGNGWGAGSAKSGKKEGRRERCVSVGRAGCGPRREEKEGRRAAMRAREREEGENEPVSISQF